MSPASVAACERRHPNPGGTWQNPDQCRLEADAPRSWQELRKIFALDKPSSQGDDPR